MAPRRRGLNLSPVSTTPTIEGHTMRKLMAVPDSHPLTFDVENLLAAPLRDWWRHNGRQAQKETTMAKCPRPKHYRGGPTACRTAANPPTCCEASAPGWSDDLG